ncbi:peptidoglycan-binding domain-containing protein [Marinobacter daepoensis]|uniref:peptidoglycan-binding domain-containing protein n=1 Tax=Marinobacter daepoensis TaxID=262077 RepID=UPI00041690E1|nr:peptidoglycan-binding domain-containing protein [Marinobacter daepoensis]
MANPDLRAFRLALIASAFVSFSGCAIQEQPSASTVSGVYAYEVGGGAAPASEEASASSETVKVGVAAEAEPGVRTEVAVAKTGEAEAAEQKTPASPTGAEESVGTPIPALNGTGAQSTDVGLEIKPGECWVYAQIQPRPVDDSVTVRVRDSEVRLDVTPAEFRRGFKQVVTREGTKTFRVEPATYKEIEERVLVKPETTRLVVEPAQYEEVQEEVVLEPARTELEPCRTSGAAAYGASSAVLGFCAREIPARTKTVTVTRLVKPETTRTEVIPAEYKTVTRKVIDKPAQVVPVKVDDEIDTLEVAELVEPAQTKQREIPAETVNVNVRRYDGRPRIVARQAVCDHKLTRDMVREIQTRLVGLGYSTGELDGLPGPNTIDALTLYQIENGLASGAITIETMEHLGLWN